MDKHHVNCVSFGSPLLLALRIFQPRSAMVHSLFHSKQSERSEQADFLLCFAEYQNFSQKKGHTVQSFEKPVVLKVIKYVNLKHVVSYSSLF